MKERKSKTIRVPLESWIFLKEKMRNERIGDHLSEKALDHLKKEMEKPYNKNGHVLMDGDLGGAVGNPENSYEEGRWTNWSVEDMKKMLDEANLPYEEGEEVSYISVGL